MNYCSETISCWGWTAPATGSRFHSACWCHDYIILSDLTSIFCLTWAAGGQRSEVKGQGASRESQLIKRESKYWKNTESDHHSPADLQPTFSRPSQDHRKCLLSTLISFSLTSGLLTLKQTEDSINTVATVRLTDPPAWCGQRWSLFSLSLSLWWWWFLSLLVLFLLHSTTPGEI